MTSYKTISIPTLLCILLCLTGIAQVRTIQEAQKVLLGGWEISNKKGNKREPGVPPYRSQFYFKGNDTCYARNVRYDMAAHGCGSKDTVILDLWFWKVISFNREKQIVKISLTPGKRIIKPGCDHSISPGGPGAREFIIGSNDSLLMRGDAKTFNTKFIRKKDQINYSPW